MSYDVLLRFQSADKRFGVVIPRSILEQMHKMCTKALPNETGGILIGSYSDDHAWAKISEISDAPDGSIHRPGSFVRNGQPLLTRLEKLWKKNQYYVGEWHYHPRSSSSPSKTDQHTMQSLSKNDSLHCPEPIMVIVGGEPSEWSLYVAVFVKDELVVLEPL